MGAWPEPKRLTVLLDGQQIETALISGYQLNRIRLPGLPDQHVFEVRAGVAAPFPDDPPPGYHVKRQAPDPRLN